MNKEYYIEFVKHLGGIETPEGWNIPTDIYFYSRDLTELPIKFNIIQGRFSCSNNKLTSLKNCPKIVHGDFFCYNNKLTSLKYSPKIVNGNFYCGGNKLTSYKYIPQKLKGIICDKGSFKGKGCYKFLLDEKIITKEEYLLHII